MYNGLGVALAVVLAVVVVVLGGISAGWRCVGGLDLPAAAALVVVVVVVLPGIRAGVCSKDRRPWVRSLPAWFGSGCRPAPWSRSAGFRHSDE
jgi:hypothetical protein